MSIYVMALIFYLWVRISKTLQLGPQTPISCMHPLPLLSSSLV